MISVHLYRCGVEDDDWRDLAAGRMLTITILGRVFAFIWGKAL